jgi:hypothetical protein
MVARWKFNDKSGFVVQSAVQGANNAAAYIQRDITDNTAFLTTAICPPCSGSQIWSDECSAQGLSTSGIPPFVGWHSADFVYSSAPYQTPKITGNAPRCKRPLSSSPYYTGFYSDIDIAVRSTTSCLSAAQKLSLSQTAGNSAANLPDVDDAILASPDSVSALHPFCEWVRLQVGGSAALLWDDFRGDLASFGQAPGEGPMDFTWLPEICAEYESVELNALTHPGQQNISVSGYGFAKSGGLSASYSTKTPAVASVEFKHLTQVDVWTNMPHLEPTGLILSNSAKWAKEICPADASFLELGLTESSIDVPLNALERALFCDGSAATSNVAWAACKRAPAPAVSAWVMPVHSPNSDSTPMDRPRTIFRVASSSCRNEGELFSVQYVPQTGIVYLQGAGKVGNPTSAGTNAKLKQDTWHFIEVQMKGTGGVFELTVDRKVLALLDMSNASAVADPRLQVCGSVCGSGWNLAEPTIHSTFQGYISQLRISSVGVSNSDDIYRPYAEIAGGGVCADDRCVPSHGKCSANGESAFAPCCREDETCYQQDGTWGQCLPTRTGQNVPRALFLVHCDKTVRQATCQTVCMSS